MRWSFSGTRVGAEPFLPAGSRAAVIAVLALGTLFSQAPPASGEDGKAVLVIGLYEIDKSNAGTDDLPSKDKIPSLATILRGAVLFREILTVEYDKEFNHEFHQGNDLWTFSGTLLPPEEGVYALDLFYRHSVSDADGEPIPQQQTRSTIVLKPGQPSVVSGLRAATLGGNSRARYLLVQLDR